MLHTNEGYNIILWIELLDLRKWPYETIVSVDDDRLGMGSTDDGTDANDSTKSVEVTAIPSIPFEKPVFQFDLNCVGDKLTFYPRHVETCAALFDYQDLMIWILMISRLL